MRWVFGFIVLMGLGWLIDRADPPLWAKLLLEVGAITVAITVVKTWERIAADKKHRELSDNVNA